MALHGRSSTALCSASIDVAAVSDPHDVDHEAVIEDLVHDPIAADADPVGILLAGELAAPGWAGVVGEQVDRGTDPLLLAAR
jgi:hypothetical protein